MNSFGLEADDMETIQFILAAHPAVETAVLYGSRARGNFKPGSDIDLVLAGKNLTDQIVLDVCAELRDSNVPYMFDIIAENTIKDENLKREINATGLVFYGQSGVPRIPADTHSS
jgi:predicted nucleotidyltransferase